MMNDVIEIASGHEMDELLQAAREQIRRGDQGWPATLLRAWQAAFREPENPDTLAALLETLADGRALQGRHEAAAECRLAAKNARQLWDRLRALEEQLAAMSGQQEERN